MVGSTAGRAVLRTARGGWIVSNMIATFAETQCLLVTFTRKHAHKPAGVGRLVLSPTGLPCVEVVSLVPIDYPRGLRVTGVVKGADVAALKEIHHHVTHWVADACRCDIFLMQLRAQGIDIDTWFHNHHCDDDDCESRLHREDYSFDARVEDDDHSEVTCPMCQSLRKKHDGVFGFVVDPIEMKGDVE